VIREQRASLNNAVNHKAYRGRLSIRRSRKNPAQPLPPSPLMAGDETPGLRTAIPFALREPQLNLEMQAARTHRQHANLWPRQINSGMRQIAA